MPAPTAPKLRKKHLLWCEGSIKYEDAQHALEQGGFNLSRPELQQLVSQLVDDMDESGDIQ